MESSRTCSICIENIKEPATQLTCGHLFCLDCLAEWILNNQRRRKFSCPFCRKQHKLCGGIPPDLAERVADRLDEEKKYLDDSFTESDGDYLLEVFG